MSVIAGLRLDTVRVPLRRPFVTAVRTAYAVDAMLVRAIADDGSEGWGEAATSWRVTGESAASVTAAVLGPLSEAVVGMPVDDPSASLARVQPAVVGNASARAAVECALYDLAARAHGLSLPRYLGGAEDPVRTDMTLSAVVDGGDIDDAVEAAREYVAAGIGTLKLKVGRGGDDLRALVAIRDAVGEAVRLRIDANQAWSLEDAIAAISSFEEADLGLELVEQPVHRDDVAGICRVARQVATPIMADESVWNARQLRELLAIGGAGVERILVNIKLAKTGGITEALSLGRLAAEHGMRMSVGCMSESHVGIAGAAALASALRGRGFDVQAPHDLDAGLWLQESPVIGGVEYLGDEVHFAAASGSGITGLRLDAEVTAHA